MPSSFRPLLLLPLCLALGCPDAPEAPEGSPPGAPTYYGAFFYDAELYAPLLKAHIETAASFLDVSGQDGCFRFESLTASDVATVGLLGIDPSAIASVGRAETFDAPVETLEEALLTGNFAEVYPSTYTEFAETAAEGIPEYREGEVHFASRSFDATIDVAGTLISFPVNDQFRRLEDWEGTGHPLAVLRGWLPSGAVSSAENASITQIFTLELLVPLEGERTERIAAVWSDLDLGLGEDSMFALGCISLTNMMGDLRDGLEGE